MSMKREYGLVILLCLGLVGCKPKGSEYLPDHATGTRSEYSLDYRTPFGGVQHASLVIRVDDDQTIQGKRYHKIVSTFMGIPGLDQMVQFSRLARDGEYTIDGDSMDKPEYLDTPLPLAVGSSWTQTGSASPDVYSAVGIETVETPAKTYKDCLKLTYKGHDKNGPTEGTVYLAPHIGMVKTIATANGVPMTLTLVKQGN
jgi:hypothetical protein